MIKFINKVDGSVFYAEPSTVQFTVLKNDSNYEIEEELIEELEDEEIKEEPIDPEPIETKEEVEAIEEKPTKKKATK